MTDSSSSTIGCLATYIKQALTSSEDHFQPCQMLHTVEATIATLPRLWRKAPLLASAIGIAQIGGRTCNAATAAPVIFTDLS